MLKALLLRATATCGCRRLHRQVLVLTKKVFYPYAFGAVTLIHQEDSADSMECALIPLLYRPLDAVQRTTLP